MRLILQVLANSAAIFLADRFVRGFSFSGDIFSLLFAGLILALINFFIRPVLKVISAPLIALSLGLFTIVINMGLLWLLDYFIDELAIVGLSAYFWSILILTVINLVFGTGKRKE